MPFKTCSYDCVYCQLGRTSNKTIERKFYVPIDDVLEELERKLQIEPFPDYISLAGSGEPTLNLGIGDLVNRIKKLTKVPIAVLTNGSLLWIPEVQESLLDADIVLPSLDAGNESSFRYVNRPHESISFEMMARGIVDFTKRFSGAVWLEVFLLGGITGVHSEMIQIAALIDRIGPKLVQLNTVVRPPVEDFAHAVQPEEMEKLKKLVPGTVELIVENSPTESTFLQKGKSDDSDIIELLSRRPCTVQGISTGLGMNPSQVTKLLQRLVRWGEIKVVQSNDMVFYERTVRQDPELKFRG
ncbi:MAG: radical SAM protein [Pseudomonadota bacterium]